MTTEAPEDPSRWPRWVRLTLTWCAIATAMMIGAASLVDAGGKLWTKVVEVRASK